jgi:hypothetical protein
LLYWNLEDENATESDLAEQMDFPLVSIAMAYDGIGIALVTLLEGVVNRFKQGQFCYQRFDLSHVQLVDKRPESAATGGKLYWNLEDENATESDLAEQMDFPSVLRGRFRWHSHLPDSSIACPQWLQIRGVCIGIQSDLAEQMDFPLVSIAMAYDGIDELDMAQIKPLIACRFGAFVLVFLVEDTKGLPGIDLVFH